MRSERSPSADAFFFGTAGPEPGMAFSNFFFAASAFLAASALRPSSMLAGIGDAPCLDTWWSLRFCHVGTRALQIAHSITSVTSPIPRRDGAFFAASTFFAFFAWLAATAAPRTIAQGDGATRKGPRNATQLRDATGRRDR
eukprot:CAMPEP_0206807226 /NCGR_PEP_ID=MMETSP0975-20121206/5127_1 /ASSEMBLY_ACC=CAM_ASM_000399 /TAXON_ID=483370 /ORGANISM="non described non described, Strain CCMP2097" /LENGTH=140 /DNA_ID=CAMNT_0054349299 /DNA_START=100 /DNA_END=519 /DNA_ORIENTATION=-